MRALCRPTSRVLDLDVERVEGDLCDPDSLARAVSGCQLVFHAAADYRLWSKNSADLYRANVNGTGNLLAAAESAGVGRVVYTSTVGCIGIPDNGIGDEDTPVSIHDMSGHYKRSKWLAEQVALKKARSGMPVVIVNPTAPVGDHDWKPTPTGRIIVNFLNNHLPAFVDTGLNLVDARDIALGHLLAAEHGRCGERYILGCQDLTLEEILARLARIAHKPAPKIKIPFAMAYAAGAVTTAWAHVTGRPPLAPLEGIRMARKKMFVSHAKAARELGYAPGSVDAALARAVDWFRRNGYH